MGGRFDVLVLKVLHKKSYIFYLLLFIPVGSDKHRVSIYRNFSDLRPLACGRSLEIDSRLEHGG